MTTGLPSLASPPVVTMTGLPVVTRQMYASWAKYSVEPVQLGALAILSCGVSVVRPEPSASTTVSRWS